MHGRSNEKAAGEDPKTTVEKWGTQGVARASLPDLNPGLAATGG